MIDILANDGRRRAVVQELAATEPVEPPFSGSDYVAIIWNGGGVTFDKAARQRIADQLIRSGCRYLVCGGVDCEAWHDDADDAWLEYYLSSSGIAPSITTTWHAGESADDVVRFAIDDTGHRFNNYLFLVVSD